MRYFSLFVLLLCFVLLETGCNNGAPGQASNESESGASDTICDADFRTVPVEEAQKDSTDYALYINNYPIPKTYKITNPRVTHFVIPIQNIDTLVQWKADGKILPNANGNDSTWMMLALEPTGSDSSTIVPYFACYTNLKGKKGPIVYFNLSEAGKVIPIPTKIAKANIDSMKSYIDTVFNTNQSVVKLYPYGFQFPWADLEGLACSLRGHLPNNSLNGVLVIREKKADGHLQKEVDYYLHSFTQRNFTKLNKKKGDDGGGEYFDFTSPCPNSCIP